MTQVILRVYDISRGFASNLGSRLLGHPLEGIWHTGVQAFDTEFFFGGGGIQQLPPAVFERDFGISPTKVLTLGVTQKSLADLQGWIRDNQHRFTESTYQFLNWNCNHFSNESVKFLLNGQSIPADILNQHEIIQRSPLGASIIGMIQNMTITNPVNQAQPSAPTPHIVPRILSAEDESAQLQSTKFGQACQTLLAQQTAQLKPALELLVVLASNIIDNSTNQKYRVIKKSSDRIRSQLLDIPGGIEALVGLGFEEKEISEGEMKESGFEFQSVTAMKLRQLFADRKLIQSVIQSRFAPVVTQPPPMAPSASLLNNPLLAQFMNAPSPPQDFKSQIDQIMAMGFTDRDACLEALRQTNGNINQALDKLIG